MNPSPLGTEKISWNLTIFYTDIHDPQIDRDIKTVESLMYDFVRFKGQLKTRLADAIEAKIAVNELYDKIHVYLSLVQSLDVTNDDIKKKISYAQAITSKAAAVMSFFAIELNALTDEEIDHQAAHPTVAKHRPWINHMRLYKNHLLSEEVESALTKRSRFSTNAWSDFFDEIEAQVVFTYQDQAYNLEKIVNELSNSKDQEQRAQILKIIDTTLKDKLSHYSAQTLYIVTQEKRVEDEDRNYANPMSQQNLENRVPDAVVETLHDTVQKYGSDINKRFYTLKARLLGVSEMKWSDRNAPLPFEDTTIIPFDQAKQIVHSAFMSFSPTLASIVDGMYEQGQIDAHMTPNRRSGAYNYSFCLPDNQPYSYTFLNYLGSTRDVMVLAHELGHGVHGILAGQTQGVLMQLAPIAYCETASVFAEMTTYHFLSSELAKTGNDQARLVLVMNKLNDITNTVMRQISFSNFERKIHASETKLSISELNTLWLESCYELYGKPGEVFTYDHADHLWSYISHFHRPFYVYGYAFGELLTDSLYAVRDQFGDRFESLYLDMLRAGSARDVVELLEPFGLDPLDPLFWKNGLEGTILPLLEEAENLATKLGY